MDENREAYLSRACYNAVMKNTAFSVFGDHAFRCLFEPFHPEASAILSAAYPVSVRRGILGQGNIVKECTATQMKKHTGAVTTDH